MLSRAEHEKKSFITSEPDLCLMVARFKDWNCQNYISHLKQLNIQTACLTCS